MSQHPLYTLANTPTDHLTAHNILRELHNQWEAIALAAGGLQSLRRNAADTAWELFTAAQSDDARFTTVPTNFQTNPYTVVAGDAGGLVDMALSGAGQLSIPTHAAVPFAIGTVIGWRSSDVGVLTIGAVTPGTTSIRSAGGRYKSSAQWAEGTITKRANDEWVLAGDLVV